MALGVDDKSHSKRFVYQIAEAPHLVACEISREETRATAKHKEGQTLLPCSTSGMPLKMRQEI